MRIDTLIADNKTLMTSLERWPGPRGTLNHAHDMRLSRVLGCMALRTGEPELDAPSVPAIKQTKVIA